MNNDAPIGIFDSGLGGLTVLKKIQQLLPNENYSENRPVEYLAKEWGFKNSSVFFITFD